MIEKRFLKCGAAAVFLFGFAQACLAADTGATATPGPATAIHAPASDWTVGQLTTMNTNGLGYCSMKNNFQTGQSLVFARDDQGSNSIALDFHRNIFKSGDLYSVKVRVGSVLRRIDALAATRQVLVMQTGIDTELYSALGHKHNVLFTVNKTNYGFELDASAADALNALRHCSESFQSGTQFSQATFPLGKVSDVAALEQADDADNIAAIANDEQPAPVEKKHHQHKHIAKAKKTVAPAEDMQQEAAAAPAPAAPATVVISGDQPAPVEASAAPSPALSATQQDTVRDDVKAEIAAEIINLRTNEQQSKGSLPGIMPAAGGGNTVAPALAPVRMSSAENADLRGLLQRSRVAAGQQIQTTANGTLRWTSDDLYGSARQMPLAPGQSLADAANGYLLKAASVCKGEFAKKMGAPQKAGQVDVLQADITCLDGQNNAAAAVLFIGNPDGRVSVITQEGTIDQLTSAMAARDAIISAAARGGKRASNDLGILHGHDPGLPDTPLQADRQLASADTGPPIKLAEQTPSPPSPISPPPVSQQNIPPQTTASLSPLPSSPSPPSPAHISPDALPLLTPSAGYQQQSFPQQISLATQMGTEFGVDISDYRYREETATADPFVNISGYMPGIEGSFTAPVPAYGWYIRAEGRAAYGAEDYSSGSGTQKGRANELGELRGIAGTDYIFNNFALSPYTGYGFRYLYDDGRGITTFNGMGYVGYRRISHYQYIPVGLIDRYRIMDQARLSTDLEYDFFTGGTQKSYDTDTNPALGDVLNRQGSGWGAKGSVLLEMGGWSVGPWFDYWHIGQSNWAVVPGSQVGPLVTISQEPNNKTTEVGFKITKQIW